MFTTVSSSQQDTLVPVTEKDFYRALGRRIAAARKAQGLSQQQLADELGIPQQTLGHYEVGRVRVAVAQLPQIARALATTVEELIGEEPRPGKRGPAPKLLQQMERIQRLPRTKQRFVMEMLDTILQQAGRERQQAQKPRDGDEATSRQRRAIS
jgi:transcriptional regulator with XRE-family HTH domain